MSDYMVSPPSLVQRTHSGATAPARNYSAGGVASTVHVQATSRVMEQLPCLLFYNNPNCCFMFQFNWAINLTSPGALMLRFKMCGKTKKRVIERIHLPNTVLPIFLNRQILTRSVKYIMFMIGRMTCHPPPLPPPSRWFVGIICLVFLTWQEKKWLRGSTPQTRPILLDRQFPRKKSSIYVHVTIEIRWWEGGRWFVGSTIFSVLLTGKDKKWLRGFTPKHYLISWIDRNP